MTVIAKPAATVVVARQSANGIEVLLLQRNSRSNFASASWVFPGGGFEDIDLGETEVETAKRCAVRETQEECGLDLELNSLQLFAHWTTPEQAPKRYATWFFLCHYKAGQAVKVDGEEMVDGLWLSPQEALQRQAQGDMHMMPPTLVCLQLLSRFEQLDQAIDALAQEQVESILPKPELVEGGVCMLYPRDAGYETSNPDLQGARHRFWMLDSGWRYESDCDWFPVGG